MTFLNAMADCPHPEDRRQAVPQVAGIAIVCLRCGATERPGNPGAPNVTPSTPPMPQGPPGVAVPKPAPRPAPAVAAPAAALRDEVAMRILVDIPPFADAHLKTFTLKAGDVATLPLMVADLLLRHGKATRIEVETP